MEGSIGWLETWLVEWLKGGGPTPRQFSSFTELNAAIRDRLAQLELPACGALGFDERSNRRFAALLVQAEWESRREKKLARLLKATCRQGYSVCCYRLPRLLVDLHIARGDGSWEKLLGELKKPDLLILDDFGLAPP